MPESGRTYDRSSSKSVALAYRGSLWPRHGVKLWLILTPFGDLAEKQ